jgi:hypothetical protein
MSEKQNALISSNATEREQLHKLLSEYLITVTDQLFQERAIYVDGYRFINCSFINCHFFILRGTFEFHHCMLSNGTNTYGEDALKIIQLYTCDFPQLRYNDAFSCLFR